MKKLCKDKDTDRWYYLNDFDGDKLYLDFDKDKDNDNGYHTGGKTIEVIDDN